MTKKNTGNPIYDRLLPAARSSIFEMEDYWIWCPSAVRADDGRYHLFASRIPRKYPFHPAWLWASDVVHALGDSATGPFRFVDVAMGARGRQYWDGRSVHNPRVLRHGDKYLMYYTGVTHPLETPSKPEEMTLDAPHTLVTRANQRIGVAIADSLDGPWQQLDRPMLDVKPNTFYSAMTSNPAPWINEDGSVVMVFKSAFYQGEKRSHMVFGAARASHWSEPFEVVGDRPIFDPETTGDIEDPYIWRDKEGYHLLAKDMAGKVTGQANTGFLAHSQDAVDWQFDPVPIAYTLDFDWDDGQPEQVGHLERVGGLIEDGELTALFFAAMDGPVRWGFSMGTRSWDMAMPLSRG